MSEFKEQSIIDDEILQVVSGGSSDIRTCKCTLCNKTFSSQTSREIVAHLNSIHKLSKGEILKEYRKIETNYVN